MDEVTLNDLLECSVCLERLDTSSKVLPCQHTFCRKCLEVSTIAIIYETNGKIYIFIGNCIQQTRIKMSRMSSIGQC